MEKIIVGLLILGSASASAVTTEKACPVYSSDYISLLQMEEVGGLTSVIDHQKLKVFRALERKGYLFLSTDEAKRHPVNVTVSDKITNYQETTTRGCYARSERIKTVDIKIFSDTQMVTRGYNDTMWDPLPAALVPFSIVRKLALSDIVDCADFKLH